MALYWWLLVALVVLLALCWLFFGNRTAAIAESAQGSASGTGATPLVTALRETAARIYKPAPIPQEEQSRAWVSSADTPLSFHARKQPSKVDVTPQIPRPLASRLVDQDAPRESNRSSGYYQTLTHKVAERVFGVKFLSNERPEWFKNPKTNKPLELDMYNPELQLAIEYNGEQHYRFPNYYHANTDAGKVQFLDQLERDEIKRSLCAQLGINLIEVPYNIHATGAKAEEHIEAFIRYFAPDAVQAREEAEARGERVVNGPATPWSVRAGSLSVRREEPASHWTRTGDVVVSQHDVI